MVVDHKVLWLGIDFRDGVEWTDDFTCHNSMALSLHLSALRFSSALLTATFTTHFLLPSHLMTANVISNEGMTT